MSYILDAIRKSESEEEQGQIPTLHSQHAVAETEPDNVSYLRLLIPAFLVLMIILSLVIWFATDGPPTGEPALAAPQTATPTEVATVRQVELKPVTNPLTREKITQPEPERVRRVEEVPPATFNDTEIVLGGNQPAAVTPVAQASDFASPTPSSQAEEGTQSGSDGVDIFTLPVTEQRMLPDIDYSSHIYSENADKSFVIINGRLLNEGDFVDGNLRLIRIRENDVLLDLKGRRYSLKSLTDFSKP